MTIVISDLEGKARKFIMEQAAMPFKETEKDEGIQMEKGTVIKDDSDSGLDNNSDSGSSWEEEPSKNFSSDSDDLSNGETPVKPERKKKKLRQFEPDVTTESKTLQFLTEKPTETVSVSKSDHASDDEDAEIGLDGLPEFFRELAKGQLETVDFSMDTNSRPEWLDEGKFRHGQKFASENLFSLNFAEMLSLIMLFAPQSVLKPLIFTGKSDTPYKAFRRYLSTLTKLKSWYEGDLWCEGESDAKKNIKAVNLMHKNVFTRLTELSPDELEKRTTLGDPRTTALWCPMREVIVEDFRNNCPMARFKPQIMKGKVWVNQLDMSITQFGFVGLAVTYPEYFGLHYATDYDLDAFCHMWRGLGYLLGIKDKYNFCNADLQTVRQRTRDFIELAVKPSFREVTEEWEHMCRCMIRGIAFYVPVVEFESSLLYLCYTINVEMPRLKKSLNLNHYMKFLTHKFVNFLQRIPGVLPRLNKRLNEFIKNAQEASPELLAKWEATEFPYMRQPGKSQIRS